MGGCANGTPWTADERAELSRLWMQTEPKLSARQIGEMLGRTKNAVVGETHRLGLPARPNPIGTAKSNPKKQTDSLDILVSQWLRGDRRIAGAVELDSWIDGRQSLPGRARQPVQPRQAVIYARTCQWQFGERHSYRECGEKTVRGSYCQAHSEVCYVGVRAQRLECEAA